MFLRWLRTKDRYVTHHLVLYGRALRRKHLRRKLLPIFYRKTVAAIAHGYRVTFGRPIVFLLELLGIRSAVNTLVQQYRQRLLERSRRAATAAGLRPLDAAEQRSGPRVAENAAKGEQNDPTVLGAALSKEQVARTSADVGIVHKDTTAPQPKATGREVTSSIPAKGSQKVSDAGGETKKLEQQQQQQQQSQQSQQSRTDRAKQETKSSVKTNTTATSTARKKVTGGPVKRASVLSRRTRILSRWKTGTHSRTRTLKASTKKAVSQKAEQPASPSPQIDKATLEALATWMAGERRREEMEFIEQQQLWASRETKFTSTPRRLIGLRATEEQMRAALNDIFPKLDPVSQRKLGGWLGFTPDFVQMRLSSGARQQEGNPHDRSLLTHMEDMSLPDKIVLVDALRSRLAMTPRVIEDVQRTILHQRVGSTSLANLLPGVEVTNHSTMTPFGQLEGAPKKLRFPGKTLTRSWAEAMVYALEEDYLRGDVPGRTAYWIDASFISGVNVAYFGAARSPRYIDGDRSRFWTVRTRMLKDGIVSSDEAELGAIVDLLLDIYRLQASSWIQRGGAPSETPRVAVIFTDMMFGVEQLAGRRPVPPEGSCLYALLEKIIQVTTDLASMGVQVELHWVPAHAGVPGNEVAHMAATRVRPTKPKEEESANRTRPSTKSRPSLPDLARGSSFGKRAPQAAPPPMEKPKFSKQQDSKPTTEPTSQSTSEPTSQQTAESSPESNTQPTTKSTTPPTTELTNKPTTKSNNQSTTQQTTKSTTQSASQSTGQSTQPTRQSTNKPTTKPTTESTNKPTTKSNNQSTPQQTTKPTTESTTKPTTQPTPQSTAQSTTEPPPPSSSTSNVPDKPGQRKRGRPRKSRSKPSTDATGEGAQRPKKVNREASRQTTATSKDDSGSGSVTTADSAKAKPQPQPRARHKVERDSQPAPPPPAQQAEQGSPNS
ncbi:hypothetical protein VTO42DRAFT_7603 [Malbranchea cinnamomea]